MVCSALNTERESRCILRRALNKGARRLLIKGTASHGHPTRLDSRRPVRSPTDGIPCVHPESITSGSAPKDGPCSGRVAVESGPCARAVGRPIRTLPNPDHLVLGSYPVANDLVAALVACDIVVEITGNARNRRFSYHPYVQAFMA